MKTTEIHWEITNRCNLRCSYCRSDSGRARPDELSTTEALAALKKFSSAGIKRICFTGGEPFSRTDLKELLEESRRLKIKVALISNATLIKSQDLDLIKHLKVELGVSLDSTIPELNDENRGAGVFTKVRSVLEQCRLKKIKSHLYVTVNQRNIGQLSDLMSLAKEYGCSIHFKELTIGGRTDQSDNQLLTPTERTRFKRIATQSARKIFKDEDMFSDESCWANGSSLFMTATGDLYLCNEIFIRQARQKLGNIRSMEFSSIGQNKIGHKCQCCYGVSASEHATIIYNTGRDCEFLTGSQSPITTLQRLYREVDKLYGNISEYCFQCKDNDCLGYIWLIKTEADRLYRAGVPLIKINDGPTFIHSFAEDQAGNINVSVKYPVCSQVDCSIRICLIRKKRPLVCHIYPAGLETLENGRIVWAMHLDCLFVRKMAEQGLEDDLEKKFLSIINRVSRPLLDEIITTYKAVNAISAFPNGSNHFKIMKGGIKNVKMHSRP